MEGLELLGSSRYSLQVSLRDWCGTKLLEPAKASDRAWSIVPLTRQHCHST